MTTCRTLTSDFRPFRRLSWRWSPAATKTSSLSVTAVTSGSFFYVWQARVFPPSTLPGVDVALLVGSLSCLPSLPPPPGSRARITPWILKCRQKVPLPPRSFLSHRTSVKRPRSPSPTLSSANAVILSKITLKLEQAFSPLQKSKGQNLVLPTRLIFLHTEGDGSGPQRQAKQRRGPSSLSHWAGRRGSLFPLSPI